MQTRPTPSLSLVYLMFNEAENIRTVLEEGLAWCRGNLEGWEIVVVDDGSTDDGAAIVREMAAQEPKIRLVQHPVNRGMGAGMGTGVRHARCDYFVFMPSDGQVLASELSKMMPLLAGADIVLSVYESRADTLGRRLMSRMFRDYMLLLANIRFLLEGLYIFPTAKAQELLPLVPADTFFFSFELVQRALEDGLRYVITVIECKPRLAGVSKVTGSRRIVRVMREVLDYRVRRAKEGRG